jgi:hypothetical protein
MSQEENLSNTKRRISTKYRKNYRLEFRYDDFIQQCLMKYRMENGLDFTKNPKLLDGIVREWHEMKTIKEFQRDDPDLAIQMRKHEDRTQWINIIYDMKCDLGEMRALRGACDFIIEYRDNKYNIKHK